jgi:hypothetical protein
VKNWDSDFIRVDIDQDADEEEYLVQLKDESNNEKGRFNDEI